ncbi:vacuolar fusion protein ccz1 [Homalodisca vitripennis]|nr:vacuolar fusion protein ccz1 [Homalodisca vitripennis]
MEMFRKWDTFLGPRLTKLVSEVSSYTSKQSSTSTGPADTATRFVYFNRMNLATKSTIHLDSRRVGNTVVTPQILRLLADINTEHTREKLVTTSLKAEMFMLKKLTSVVNSLYAMAEENPLLLSHEASGTWFQQALTGVLYNFENSAAEYASCGCSYKLQKTAGSVYYICAPWKRSDDRSTPMSRMMSTLFDGAVQKLVLEIKANFPPPEIYHETVLDVDSHVVLFTPS